MAHFRVPEMSHQNGGSCSCSGFSCSHLFVFTPKDLCDDAGSILGTGRRGCGENPWRQRAVGDFSVLCMAVGGSRAGGGLAHLVDHSKNIDLLDLYECGHP